MNFVKKIQLWNFKRLQRKSARKRIAMQLKAILLYKKRGAWYENRNK